MPVVGLFLLSSLPSAFVAPMVLCRGVLSWVCRMRFFAFVFCLSVSAVISCLINVSARWCIALCYGLHSYFGSGALC